MVNVMLSTSLCFVCVCVTILHVRVGVRVQGRMRMRVRVVLRTWSYGKRTRKPLTLNKTNMKTHHKTRQDTDKVIHRQVTGKAQAR